MKRNMEFWCNDPEKGEQKYWKKNLSQYPFFDHILYVDWSIIEPEPPR
jgi:hypothetical protein